MDRCNIVPRRRTGCHQRRRRRRRRRQRRQRRYVTSLVDSTLRRSE